MVIKVVACAAKSVSERRAPADHCSINCSVCKGARLLALASGASEVHSWCHKCLYEQPCQVTGQHALADQCPAILYYMQGCAPACPRVMRLRRSATRACKPLHYP